MSEPRLEHQNVKVKQLIDNYRPGRIVIPEFPRKYVWKKSKAPLLIDSLYRGFPVSSLLLWQSDEETRLRRREPRPTKIRGWLGSQKSMKDGLRLVTAAILRVCSLGESSRNHAMIAKT